MKKLLIVLLTIIFLSIRIEAQEPTIYLPIIFNDSSGQMANNYPIFAITNGTERINLLDSGSGIQLADPYWSPNVAQLKGGGTHINPQTTSGQSLVAAEYDNVIETIPLRITGPQGNVTLENLRRLFSLSVNAQGYWTRIFEQDQVWLEIRADCDNMLTAYSTIYTLSIGGISSPYTTPFVNQIDKSEFDTVNLILEREPFFSPLQPGEIIGPLYNLVKNPDFELWNGGIVDNQPDSWDDLENNMFGTNNRSDDAKWGNYSLKVEITGSGAANSYKGVTQVMVDTKNNTEYTVIAWVKNDGIGKGVGRILVNYSTQLELYNEDEAHDWTMYTGKITTGIDDVVSINCEILATDANTTGTIYFDGLMFIEGDFEQYAEDNLLPYMTSSHIVNHWDYEQGDINFVDVWNVPGDVDSLIRLEFVNNTEDVNFETIRIGLRRTGDIFQFNNYLNVPGIPDTTSSHNDYVVYSVDDEWTTVGTANITNSNIVENTIGRHKLLSRVYDIGDSLKVRGQYWIGTSQVNTKILDSVSSQVDRDWQIIDVTAYSSTINYDNKYQSQQPSGLGYSIQFMRTNGTGNAYIDYAMLMPTDGGYLDGKISPYLTYRNSLIADNTISSTISATWSSKFDWTEILNYGGGNTGFFANYKDHIYILTGQNNYWRSEKGEWTYYDIDPTFGADYLMAVAEYGGYLYGIVDRTALVQAILFRSADGITWTVADPTVLNRTPHDITTFNGYLWIATGTTVYRWDGTNILASLNIGTTVYCLQVWGGKLYAGTRDNLYVWNPTTNVWSIADTVAAGETIYSLKEFNGYLYAGTASNGRLYRYDGSDLTLVYTFNTVTEMSNIYALEVYNEKLYATGFAGAVANAPVFQTENGTDWTETFTATGVSNWRLSSLNGQIYLYSVDITTFIYTLSDKESTFKPTTYKGGGFYAPPRDKYSDSRHRYFFNYDRENYINNIDDKALIGIGYRPRYLSLISKEDF